MKSSFARLYRVPLLLALLTCTGLFFALLSDDWGDWLGWVCLLLPIILAGRILFDRPPKIPGQHDK